MNNLTIRRWPLMVEAAPAGGEGGAGGGVAGGGEGVTPSPASAAAAHAGGGEGGAGGGEGAAPSPASAAASPASAAAAHTGDTADKPKEEPPADLAKMTDEDWAKAVLPDPEDENAPKPDRAILTPMAKELREAGVQPSVMRKVVGAYEKSVDAFVKQKNEARAARMAELTAKCEKEVTAEQWKDFAAAYTEHIAKDRELADIVNHTELGSNPAFIRRIALAGATLRVETPPAATAAGGTSQTDLDRRVFEQTVPAHLR